MLLMVLSTGEEMAMTDLKLFTNSALRTMSKAVAMPLALAIIAALTTLVPSGAYAQAYRTYGIGNAAAPTAGVTIKGDFVYGTAPYGGGGSGAVYEVKHLGTLVSFVGGPPGPEARVVFGPDAHLYGTYTDNGSNSCVFTMVPNPTICTTPQCQPWKTSVPHCFTGFPSDGAEPGYGDLTWDQLGNIYGTTILGGSSNVGVVYELMPPVPPSKTWTEEILWNFTGPDGANPQNTVIFDANGSLLSTTKQGGAYGFGTVFKLTPSGNGWLETNIYDFQGGNDGKYPIGGLIADSSGNLYGATTDGGGDNLGGGVVYELIPSGNTYTFRLLYTFPGNPGQGCGPRATLSMDAAGNLYGTTYCHGPYGQGSVFKLSNTQNGWAFSSLHDFGNQFDLVRPVSNVTFDTSGSLWGTATGCLPGGCQGGVWQITP
jgi:uncharacterized repeat protein (TIGR03803 family)